MARSTNRSTPHEGDSRMPATGRYRRMGLRCRGYGRRAQAPQIRRPVRERLRRPRLIGELTDGVPGRRDTDGIVAEEARRLVQGLNLPVDLMAHRDGRPRRRPMIDVKVKAETPAELGTTVRVL